jgi:CspA family cold shock protein
MAESLERLCFSTKKQQFDHPEQETPRRGCPREGKTMPTGSVKWFNNAKGYGFVRPDTGGDDLFVHYSYIKMDGYRSLKAGQFVQFDIQASNNGFHAVNLTTLGGDQDSSHHAGTQPYTADDHGDSKPSGAR